MCFCVKPRNLPQVPGRRGGPDPGLTPQDVLHVDSHLCKQAKGWTDHHTRREAAGAQGPGCQGAGEGARRRLPQRRRWGPGAGVVLAAPGSQAVAAVAPGSEVAGHAGLAKRQGTLTLPEFSRSTPSQELALRLALEQPTQAGPSTLGMPSAQHFLRKYTQQPCCIRRSRQRVSLQSPGLRTLPGVPGPPALS